MGEGACRVADCGEGFQAMRDGLRRVGRCWDGF